MLYTVRKKKRKYKRQSSFFRIISSWRDFIQTQPQCPAFRLRHLSNVAFYLTGRNLKIQRVFIKKLYEHSQKCETVETTSAEHFNTRRIVL